LITIGKDILKPKPNEHCVNILDGWRNAKDYYTRKFRREIENWRFYWAHDPELGLGQWPDSAVAYMINQNRQMLTYNFIKPIVDTIAGGIMQIPFDPEFYPVNEEITSLTHAIKKAMYSDKEIMDWNSTYLQTVTGGLIHESVMKMVVSDEYDELGNIGFKNCLPGTVMATPYWKDWGSKSCRKCWQESWYSDEELMSIYKDKADLIKLELALHKDHSDTYGSYSSVTPYVNESDGGKWGSLHRVIEEYSIVDEARDVEFALTENGKVMIPDNIEDIDKPAWLNEYHPTWRPDHVYTEKRFDKICYVKAVSPTISNFYLLEDGKTEIQIGRLPYFWWSASRANGESHSIVDSIKDVQTNINYHESLITYKIQTEGGGGAQLVDRSGFVDDREYKRFLEKRNDPTENFEVRPGLISDEGKTVSMPVRKSEFPSEVYQHLNHIVDVLLPHISKVTPAQRGFQSGASESGKLFELLKIQSDQQLYTIHYGLRIFWNEVYEAYFMQASNTYSNETLPRKFTFNQGKESITLNEPIVLPDGRKAIKNDVRELKRIRHKVIISEQQQSPTQKLEELDSISKFMKNIPANKPATLQYMVMEAAKRMSSFNEENIEALESIGEKELELQMTEIGAKIVQAKVAEFEMTVKLKGLQLQDIQLDKQLQAAKNPPPPAPPTIQGQGQEQDQGQPQEQPQSVPPAENASPGQGYPVEGGDPRNISAQEVNPSIEPRSLPSGLQTQSTTSQG